MSTASRLSSRMDVTDPAEIRCERRYKAPAGVKLSLQAPPDAVSEEAELHDISLRGLGIVTAHYVEPGLSVVVRMGARRLEGVVKYCNADRSRYRAGVLVHHSTSERCSLGGRDWDTLLVRSRRSTTSN